MYTILFVEDDPTAKFLVGRYACWDTCGFRVAAWAKNGREALEILEKQTFDLVITDIRMPVMGGLELLEEIGRRYPDSSVMLASSYSDFTYAKRGLILGAVDYIEKPYAEQNLLEALKRAKEVLDTRPAPGAVDLFSNQQAEILLSDLLRGRADAAGIVAQQQLSFPDDAAGAIAFFRQALQKTWALLLEKFSWLQQFELLDTDLDADDLERSFSNRLCGLQEIVAQYELGAADGFLRQVCEATAKHLDASALADQTAQEMFISKDYLGRLVKQHTGRSFGDFATSLKMKAAQRMLQEGLRNAEIGRRLGYTTDGYFSRVFKTSVGMTPAEYKKAVRQR